MASTSLLIGPASPDFLHLEMELHGVTVVIMVVPFEGDHLFVELLAKQDMPCPRQSRP